MQKTIDNKVYKVIFDEKNKETWCLVKLNYLMQLGIASKISDESLINLATKTVYLCIHDGLLYNSAFFAKYNFRMFTEALYISKLDKKHLSNFDCNRKAYAEVEILESLYMITEKDKKPYTLRLNTDDLKDLEDDAMILKITLIDGK